MSFQRPSVAWGFLAGSRLFEGSAAPAAAAAASKLFLGDFQKGRFRPRETHIFGLRSSFRAMVFPRPGGPCLCGHSSSSSSSRCRPSVAWGFLAGSRLFGGSAAPAAAAAAPSSQHRETYSKLFLRDFRRDVPAPGKRLFWTSIRPSGPWCFPVREGRVFPASFSSMGFPCRKPPF